ncbi:MULTISPECIES: hypothetical protein [Rhodomicrobium]|uniref:hypothetical protein n=1 Tax=Rhodomicrobium TaxID=1068 RepID=UPI000F74947D|nr:MULTISPECIES: hypothetical protein [Rhodomicrobium]
MSHVNIEIPLRQKTDAELFAVRRKAQGVKLGRPELSTIFFKGRGHGKTASEGWRFVDSSGA